MASGIRLGRLPRFASSRVAEALAATGGNVSKTAAQLGTSRSVVNAYVSRYSHVAEALERARRKAAAAQAAPPRGLQAISLSDTPVGSGRAAPRRTARNTPTLVDDAEDVDTIGIPPPLRVEVVTVMSTNVDADADAVGTNVPVTPLPTPDQPAPPPSAGRWLPAPVWAPANWIRVEVLASSVGFKHYPTLAPGDSVALPPSTARAWIASGLAR